MDEWGPAEWAVAWQSAPARLLEGSTGGGQRDVSSGTPRSTGVAGGSVGRAMPCDRSSGGQQGARPPDGRPPTRRPSLARLIGRRSSARARQRDDGEDGGATECDLPQLGNRIRGMAADLAASLREWLHLVEEFDRERGWADAGLQSCAAWLSWTCSVAPGTAREYVRIARALPLLPLIDEAFAAGRLSYSKVRVLVQVAAEVDESVLLQQAQIQTVSQLERTVRAYRRGDGWSQQRKRRAVWRWDADGMLVASVRLPPEEGALLVAALERSRDDIAPRVESVCGAAEDAEAPGGDDSSGGDEVPGGDEVSGGDDASDRGDPGGDDPGGDEVRADGPAPNPDTELGRQPMPPPTDDDRQRAALTGADPLGTAGADMLVALARRALAAGEVDSSGDDRHLLVLHADLAELAGDADSTDPGPADPGPADPGLTNPDPADPGPIDSGSTAPDPADADPAADAAGPGGVAAPDVPGDGRHSWRRTAAASTLASPRCHLEDGPGLDRRTAQRIACDAAILAVLHHVGKGEPLRLGRKTRAISPALRRALRIRDGGCRFPGCHRRTHLEAHHVQHWSLLGPTDLENLVLLCPFHHMLIHEGGFRVSPSAGGWEFHDSHGAPVTAAPPLPGSDTGGVPPAAAAEPLGLLSAWAGEPFHLAETVAVLARSPRSDAGTAGPGATSWDGQAHGDSAP